MTALPRDYLAAADADTVRAAELERLASRAHSMQLARTCQRAATARRERANLWRAIARHLDDAIARGIESAELEPIVLDASELSIESWLARAVERPDETGQRDPDR